MQHDNAKGVTANSCNPLNLLVPGAGIEPAWPCGRGILSFLCLCNNNAELLVNRHAKSGVGCNQFLCLAHFLCQPIGGEAGVDFGDLAGAMAHHFLHGPQADPSLDHMDTESVAH